MKNMREIDVNSMEYRKLSKEDKLRVVKLKIKDILESKDTKLIQVYYKGKKVNVPKNKEGIFRDLCEREKNLEKTVTIKEEDIETIEDIINENSNLFYEIDVKIKYIKKCLYDMSLLYKMDKYKSSKIIKIEGYNKETVYIPYSKYGDYKTLFKYLKLLEKEKRQLEVENIKNNENNHNNNFSNFNFIDIDANSEKFEKDIYQKSHEIETLFNNVKDKTVNNSDINKKNLALEELNKVYSYFNYLYNMAMKYLNKNGYDPICVRDYDGNQTYIYAESLLNLRSDIVKGLINIKNIKKKIEGSVSQEEKHTDNNELIDNNDINLISDNEKNKEKGKFGKKVISVILTLPFVKKIIDGSKKVINKGNKTLNKVKEIFSKKNRKNRLKVKVGALILAVSTVVCCFLPRKVNKKDNVTKEFSSISYTSDNKIEKDNIKFRNSTEEDTVIEEVIDKDIDYSLGDVVNIENNAYIYTNSYDATDETNNYTPYYDGTYDREVVGVTYELDGKLYTL